jgi:hypothetical protein
MLTVRFLELHDGKISRGTSFIKTELCRLVKCSWAKAVAS